MSNDTEVKVRGSFINRYAGELTNSNNNMSTYCRPTIVTYIKVSPNSLLVMNYEPYRTEYGHDIRIRKILNVRDIIVNGFIDNIIYDSIFEIISTVVIDNIKYFTIKFNSTSHSARYGAEIYYYINKIKKLELLVPVDAPIIQVARSYDINRSSLLMNPLTPDQAYDYNKNDRIITITKIPTIIPDMGIKSYDNIVLLKRNKIFNLELTFKKDEKNIRTKGFRLFKRRR